MTPCSNDQEFDDQQNLKLITSQITIIRVKINVCFEMCTLLLTRLFKDLEICKLLFENNVVKNLELHGDGH